MSSVVELILFCALALGSVESPAVKKLAFGQKDVLFSIAIDGKRAAAGWGDRVVIYESGAEAAVIRAENADVKGGFGFAVALSGDTLVASRVNGFDRNIVYIYEKRGAWKLVASLWPSKPVSSPSGFGASLAIDGARLAIPNSDESVVYVYERSPDWKETRRLKAASVRDVVALHGADIAVAAADGVFVFTSVGKPVRVSSEGGSSLSFADDGCLAIGAFRSGKSELFCHAKTGWDRRAEFTTGNSGRVLKGFGVGLAASRDLVLVGNLVGSLTEHPPGELYAFAATAREWRAIDLSFIGRNDERRDQELGRLVALSGRHALVAGQRTLYFLDFGPR